jgi:hypothetical protein
VTSAELLDKAEDFALEYWVYIEWESLYEKHRKTYGIEKSIFLAFRQLDLLDKFLNRVKAQDGNSGH